MGSNPGNHRQLTVLVTSAGATNALNVIDALRRSSLDVRILAADADPLAAGLFMAERHFSVPLASDPQFVRRVLTICAENEVDIVVPIYSAELPTFAQNVGVFHERGIRLCVPGMETLTVCDDKLRTIEFFGKIGVPCPKTWTSAQLPPADRAPFPLFLKKRTGSGSKDAWRVNDRRELAGRMTEQHIIQEYVEGQEYTVDVVSDLSGRMLAASPRIRTRIYGGLSVRGQTVDDQEIVGITRKIVETLRLPGPSNVQCKRTPSGRLTFIEVNPRFASGGLPLAVAAGLNIPEILLRLLMGWPIPRISIRTGVIMNRYWSAQFLKEGACKDAYEILD